MADGIKIRALNTTTTITAADVLIVDKLNNITGENITYQITVGNLSAGLFTNNPDFTIDTINGITLTGVADGDILYYDDGWVNKPSADLFTLPLQLVEDRVSVVENKVSQLENSTTQQRIEELESKILELEQHLSRLIEIE